jgi:isopentenyl diphosphate isomerase/L-lactate dehydrogenase-like FMN-dependent dehydrogenase
MRSFPDPRISRTVVTLDDLEALARRRLPRMVFDFIAGGAEDEHTLDLNCAAFRRVVLKPRVLAGATRRTTAVEVAGQRLALPVLLAPTGLSKLAGAGGELSAAAAAERAGTVSVVSSASSMSITEIGQKVARPQWFQLYPWGDRSLTSALVERARQAGCTTLVVTVDVPTTGARERDTRNGLTIPPRIGVRTAMDILRHPRWLAGLAADRHITLANLDGLVPKRASTASSLGQLNLDLLNPGYDWEDLRWLRGQWDGTMLVKGVLDPDDAIKVVESGCDGVIVSNHGGRQADPVSAALNALPAIADAVGDRCDVLMDGGVRRGADVLIALALGASAVLVGRPWMYGLAVGGEAGVGRMLQILATEIDRTMTLIGCPDFADLDRSWVSAAHPALWAGAESWR